MIRIVLVDDHPMVRQGLVSALEDEPDFGVVLTTESEERALASVAALRPNVVLLDLELPGMNGAGSPRTRLYRLRHG